jgi:hypothetical protein
MREVTSEEIKTSVKRGAKKAEYSPVMEGLTRLGFAVRGLIYIVIGLLALQLVLGKGGKLASPQQAIAEIGKNPAGMILLWVVLLGLISYSLWGLVRAFLDPLQKGHDLKGIIARFGFLISALGYAILIMPTYGYITGNSQSASGSQNQNFISSIMTMPSGRWIVGIVGLATIIGGFYQIYQGLKAKFDRQFQVISLKPDQAKIAISLARYGTAARGIVFALVGGLICLAAYQANPSQPTGMDAALATLLKLPFGIWLLAIIAIGLIAFGAYSMMSALWFRLRR